MKYFFFIHRWDPISLRIRSFWAMYTLHVSISSTVLLTESVPIMKGFYFLALICSNKISIAHGQRPI